MRKKFNRPFVFISHASADNARIRPVLIALLDAGLPIWFDKPYLSSINLDKTLFEGIIGHGDRFGDKINEAISSACAFIVFPSAHARKSLYVAKECGFAQSQKGQRGDDFLLYSAILNSRDIVHEQQFTNGISAFSVTVSAADKGRYQLTSQGVENVELLITALKSHIEKFSVKAAVRVPQGTSDGDYDTPYLADRAVQRDAALAAFSNVSRPPVFVIYGPANEAVQRFTTVNFPRRIVASQPIFRHSGTTASVIFLRWPMIANKEKVQFQLCMAHNILEHLQSARQIDSVEDWNSLPILKNNILQSLKADDTTRLIVSRINSEDYSVTGIFDAIDSWANFWNDTEFDTINSPRHFLLIPVLLVKYPSSSKSKGGWVSRFIRSAMHVPVDLSPGKFRKNYLNIDLHFLPRLRPITRQCVSEWIADDDLFKTKSEGWREEISEKLMLLFSLSDNGRNGLPMQEWVKLSRPILQSAGIE